MHNLFWEARVANDYFPTIAIVGGNDDRRRSFAQVYLTYMENKKAIGGDYNGGN